MILLKVFFITTFTSWVSCTISGLNYMEPINFKPLKSRIPGEDPCNPLYWYPRNIPDYCYYKKSFKPGVKPKPIPLPVPVPLPPQPFPFPIPIPSQPYPMLPPFPVPQPYPIPPYPMSPMAMPAPPIPMPIFSPPLPLPYGIPLEPTNPMLPVAGVPGFPYFGSFQPFRAGPQAGMVPGIPGLVTEDGGINVLPFSDAYADILEKHKQKIIRKKLQRVLDEYDGYSSKHSYTKYG